MNVDNLDPTKDRAAYLQALSECFSPDRETNITLSPTDSSIIREALLAFSASIEAARL